MKHAASSPNVHRVAVSRASNPKAQMASLPKLHHPGDSPRKREAIKCSEEILWESTTCVGSSRIWGVVTMELFDKMSSVGCRPSSAKPNSLQYSRVGGGEDLGTYKYHHALHMHHLNSQLHAGSLGKGRGSLKLLCDSSLLNHHQLF